MLGPLRKGNTGCGLLCRSPLNLGLKGKPFFHRKENISGESGTQRFAPVHVFDGQKMFTMSVKY